MQRMRPSNPGHLLSHSYLTSVTDFLKFLAAFCLYTTPDTDSAQFSDLWSSMVFFHAPISRKGFGNNNNNKRIILKDQEIRLVFLLRW